MIQMMVMTTTMMPNCDERNTDDDDESKHHGLMMNEMEELIALTLLTITMTATTKFPKRPIINVRSRRGGGCV